MTEAEVRTLAARMASGPTINSFLTSEALKFLFGLSLEAHGVHAGHVARSLHLGGARSPETAAVIGDTKVYAPANDSPFHDILVMERSGDVFALSVEWGGKPNPEAEAMLARLLGGRTAPRRESGPVLDRARRIKAFALRGHHEIDGLADDVAGDAWRDDCLMSTTPAIEAPPEGWIPGNAVVSSVGVDRWPEFFDALRQALTQAPAPASFASATTDIGQRRWVGTGDGMAEYDAARELGTRLAEADGFLPGRASGAGLAALYAVQAEMNVAKFARDGWFERIHAACTAAGHVDAASSFDFNDCDDHVFAGERAGNRTLSFRDDNYRTVVEIVGDAVDGAVTVSVAAADGEYDPELLASFAVEGGEIRSTRRPSSVGDDVRAWNSFVSILESADCVLEEEYGRRPTP